MRHSGSPLSVLPFGLFVCAGLGAQQAPAAPPAAEPAVVVIEAGTVHPVAGPAIADGVVVVRGERIVAVGKRGEVEIPAGATVRKFPDGHVYPGLVDAATDAFTDAALRGEGNQDGGSELALDLRPQGTRDDELAAAGITTAYVTVRSPAVLRGQGAIVRPQAGGFALWAGRDKAALQLRMTNGLGPSHPLQRQQQLDGTAALFDGLDDYKKAFADHAEALKKYDKEFADYLAWHQKKKDGEKKEGAAAPAGAPAGDGAGRPGGARSGRPGGAPGEARRVEPPKNDPPKEEPKPKGTAVADPAAAALALSEWFLDLTAPQDPPKQDPPKPAGQEPAPAAPPAGAAAAPPAEKKDEAPKRPTYPKAPPRDPQKEALLQVLDGKLPLRVEAHRPDEIRGALKLQRERNVPVLVLEQAYGAAAVAAELAERGTAVVLTEVWPGNLPKPYDAFSPVALPAALHRAGVPFAIASGSGRRGAILPLMAAAAVGHGLPRDAALRAITLSAAEILGVAADTGSLQPGKFADLLVTDRPLFQSDSRPLLVLSQGRPAYEAQ